MPLTGFFVTGTGTGVGKTAVAAALCRLIRQVGMSVAPVKPVQTGVLPGEPGDLEVCLNTAGMTASDLDRSLMNPYRFRLPASPHLAAEREKQTVEPMVIMNACRELSRSYDRLIVESAGGLLVPLTREYSTLDLAAGLGLPLIVVARAALGAINHTLLTLRAARAAGLTVAAVVLNRPDSGPGDETERLIEDDNRRVIWETGLVKVLGPLPHIPGAGAGCGPTVELALELEKAGAVSLI
jgi:dethiobiotin synthetase